MTVLFDVRDGFDLDKAIGKQLDMLAAYRGLKRAIVGTDLTKVYMATPRIDDPDIDTYKGEFRVAAGAPSWYTFRISDGARNTYEMNDDEFRRLIKLRARVHSSGQGTGEVDAILNEFFPGRIQIIDNKDMTIVYHDTDPTNPDTLFALAVATKSLPRPAGVSMTTS